MAENPADRPETLTAQVVLDLFDRRVEMEIVAPVEPVRMDSLLPLIQSLTDTIVGVAVQACQDQHVEISCKKGCGSCCVQLVPIAPVEARYLRDLIEGLPEPRRSTVRERFGAAQQRLAKAELLGTLMDTSELRETEVMRLGIDYLKLQIPCPFLEDQACSIHLQRPIRCREYLVTSSPEYCGGPEAKSITRVRLPAQVFRSMLAVGGESRGDIARWIPMIVAPRWADEFTDDSAPRPGTQLVQELFETLSSTKLSPPEPPL